MEATGKNGGKKATTGMADLMGNDYPDFFAQYRSSCQQESTDKDWCIVDAPTLPVGTDSGAHMHFHTHEPNAQRYYYYDPNRSAATALAVSDLTAPTTYTGSVNNIKEVTSQRYRPRRVQPFDNATDSCKSIHVWSSKNVPETTVEQSVANSYATDMNSQLHHHRSPTDFSNIASWAPEPWMNQYNYSLFENRKEPQMRASVLAQNGKQLEDAATQTDLFLLKSYTDSLRDANIPLFVGHYQKTEDCVQQHLENLQYPEGDSVRANNGKQTSSDYCKLQESPHGRQSYSQAVAHNLPKTWLQDDSDRIIVDPLIEEFGKMSTPNGDNPKKQLLRQTSVSPIEMPRRSNNVHSPASADFSFSSPFTRNTSSSSFDISSPFECHDDLQFAPVYKDAVPDGIPFVTATRSKRGRRSSTYTECSFCKNNKERAEIYKSHCLKDISGQVTCPVLRAYRCPICQKTGDDAHTISHCPRNVGPVPVAVALNNTPRDATGKFRKKWFQLTESD